MAQQYFVVSVNRPLDCGNSITVQEVHEDKSHAKRPTYEELRKQWVCGSFMDTLKCLYVANSLR
jgi:hypothetical protein